MTNNDMKAEGARPIIIDPDGDVILQKNSLVYHHDLVTDKEPLAEIELPSLESLDNNLNRQFDYTLSLYEGILPPEQLDRLRVFAERYYSSRYVRGNELDTPELNLAREQKAAFHGEGNHFFLVTCIDGRNIPTIMFTFIPHSEGGFIRTQAGDLSAFKQQYRSDEVRLDKDTDYYRRLLTILKDYAGETIYYGLDSHVGCAARGGMSADSGSVAEDGGLYEDIARKKKIAEELNRIVEELRSSGEDVATLIPDLFSYDPHQGTMIMGLKRYIDEIDPNIGFTPEIRQKLSAEGKIIDTWDLLNEPDVIRELETHISHTADFRHNYVQSVAKNWQALTDLYDGGDGKVYKILMQKLHAIYDEDGKNEDELDHKAKLLMKNIVTRWSIARNGDEWEYDTHKERVIVSTERAFGPFADIDHFLVSSFEGEAEVIANIKTSNGLIRKFRREGSIPDRSTDVLLIDNEAVVKDLVPNADTTTIENEWQKIQTVALDLFSRINWDHDETELLEAPDIRRIWYQAIAEAVNKSGVAGDTAINALAANNVTDGIWEVFSRMRSIMRDPTFANHLASGKTVVLNTIVDQNGRPRMIVPLIPHANGNHQVQ